MTDFDKLFENYIQEWIGEHKGEYNADEIEDKLPELYNDWACRPCPEIGGVSPEDYFAAITSPEALMAEFEGECAEFGSPCSLLTERIVETPECAPKLCALALGSTDPACVLAAMDVMEDMGADRPLSAYADWLADDSRDEGERERAAEILKEEPNAVKDRLLALVPSASDEAKDLIADVLAESEHDDRTFELLKEVFLSGRNVPYAAGLLGKYGDERAAAFLYPALDECNYAEFIEIRNAIEQLGGVVDDEYRDFSDDALYKAIKGGKGE